ncbi:PucR family transcriptional regulator [Actinomadura rudentiformis]|uniref:PucR family transcriptional regulator n=1 Tax=Actinomadura rudentiformis TaxID=359158 RepID=A0A6H9YPU4_9ACTN|nr:helix-turn-helix domain-containing protein [Actinomadura rudentiformis]KAB2347006.1 PucR family transcriptional regulator [Actinomadura rudentiformis]
MSDRSRVVGLPVRRIELGLSFKDDARIARDLRPHVPGIAAEAVRRIQERVPEFRRPHDHRYAEALGLAVEYAIGHFLDLLADPGTESGEVLEYWRRIGVGEALEGRTLDAWQASTRIGAGVAVERLTERAESLGHRTTAAIVAGIANAVFGYLNQLADAVAAGHADAAARAAGAHQDRRRRLLDLLLAEPAPDLKDLREPSREAGWPLPQTVAAVALREHGADSRRPPVPPDVLLGLHLSEPCLIVPDPDGPGRHRFLRQQLRGWTAAIGPTVEITELATSMRWAASALELAVQGLIHPAGQIDPARRTDPACHNDTAGLIVAESHMPIILMMRERELVERMIKRRLAPLLTVRPAQRYRLAETLVTCLECGFNATEVAGRLHVHAQTVRYRIRQLDDLFGDDIHAVTGRLELHMALRAWLTLNAEPLPSDQLSCG